MTIEFWIGIVFWCFNQACGLATHTDSFSICEECMHEVKIMKNQKLYILEGRGSPQKINILDNINNSIVV